MESLVQWFTTHLSPYISEQAVVFLISMLPILELRGGLLAASLYRSGAFDAIVENGKSFVEEVQRFRKGE